MLTPIIFLDIDGVLNLVERKASRDPATWLDRAMVARLDAAATGAHAQIVVSSSWRRDTHCRDHLRAAGLTATFHIDWRTEPFLPTEKQLDPCRPRASEIAHWLMAHDEAYRENRQASTPYAIVDDETSLFLHQVPNLIEINPTIGFTERDSNRLARHLGGYRAAAA